MSIPLIMSLFIVLGKMTDTAIEHMKKAKERDEKAEQIIKSAGGTLISYYYTLGRFDFVAIIELPSPEILTNVLIEMGKWGKISTETMTALLPEQMYKMAAGTYE